MRKVFIQCESRYMARKQALWAAVCAKVNGGYMCFESASDYWTWRYQK